MKLFPACSRRRKTLFPYWMAAGTLKTTAFKDQCCGSASGIRFLFDPWIRDPGWTSRIIFPRFRNNFCVKLHKFFNADPGIFLTLDTGWKKFGSGMQDNHPGSATLLKMNHFCGTDYNFINFFYFCGSFCPPGSGSRDRIESGSHPDLELWQEPMFALL